MQSRAFDLKETCGDFVKNTFKNSYSNPWKNASLIESPVYSEYTIWKPSLDFSVKNVFSAYC